MWKDDLNVHLFRNRNWCSPKSDRWFFFSLSLSEDFSIEMILKSDSQLQKKKNVLTCLIESSLKVMKNAFYLILGAFLVLNIFKFLSRLFGHIEKTAWLKRYSWFQNSWRHNVVYKQLQYSYFPISNIVKTTRQLNLVNW